MQAAHPAVILNVVPAQKVTDGTEMKDPVKSAVMVMLHYCFRAHAIT